MALRLIPLWGLRISSGAYSDAVAVLVQEAKTKGFKRVLTLNPEIWVQSRQDEQIKDLVQRADRVVLDGVGTSLAVRWLYGVHVERLTGLNLTFSLLRQGGLKVYVVGADLSTIRLLEEKVRSEFPGIKWVGFHHGFLGVEETEAVIEDIVAKKPDLVLVGMGFPKQEFFLDQVSKQLDFGMGMGIGGVLDVLAGKKGHAPAWVQALGVEWIYHGFRSPSRMKRWGRLIRFCFEVVAERLTLLVQTRR